MECLRPLRKAKGLTMKELGKMVDVSESMIGLIEKGKRKPSYETLLKLTEVFGVTVDDLMHNRIPATISDGQKEEEEDFKVSDYDKRFLEWFHSIPPEKRKAILISQDAPEDLL